MRPPIDLQMEAELRPFLTVIRFQLFFTQTLTMKRESRGASQNLLHAL